MTQTHLANIFFSSPGPSPIKSVSIEPSKTSPDDTVVMTWEKGTGVTEFHRISMEGPDGVVFHADVPVTEASDTNLHNVSLSPVVIGGQYQVTIWSMVNKDVLSSPTEVRFMFGKLHVFYSFVCLSLQLSSGRIGLVFLECCRKYTFLKVVLLA